MRNINLFAILTFLMFSFSSAMAQISGSLLELSFIGPVTKGDVNFSIYLPKDYKQTNKAYSVIYHLHGLGDNHRSLSREMIIGNFESAMELGFLDDVIIVFPHGYENSMWGNSIYGDKPAETNIIEELIPYIDAKYRTIPNREHRFIQGFSMGGFGAVKFMAKFPDIFSRCVSFDGGMRTWKTLQSGRIEIAANVFQFNEQHFNEYSPWKYLRENRAILSIDTLFYAFVGDFTSFNKTFFDSLNYYGIPFKSVKDRCGHDLQCILDREWLTVVEYYAGSISLATDVSISQIRSTDYSLSSNNSTNTLEINFSNTKVGKVKIEIINMFGSTVFDVLNSYELAGNHRLSIDLRQTGISKGTYFIAYSSPEGMNIQKIIVLK